jgi:hypothetical protein
MNGTLATVMRGPALTIARPIRVGGNVIRPLNRRSALTLFTSLERLGGPAADSPLIRERRSGSRAVHRAGQPAGAAARSGL